MKKNFLKFSGLLWAACSFIIIIAIVSSCRKTDKIIDQIEKIQLAQSLSGFKQVDLVANNTEYGEARADSSFVNAWGLAFGGTGIPWINAEETGFSFVLSRAGAQLIPPVTIPSPTDSLGGGHPRGIVFNSSTDFIIPSLGQSALFIFSGGDGVISAWRSGIHAVRILSDSAASYSGLALAADGSNNFLYAANFGGGKIDVFDKNFVKDSTKHLVDPSLPAGYAPFNIQNIGGMLYVAYALKQGADEVKGSGNGYVSIFKPDGSFVKRFASRNVLNAPWGLAKAPAGFGGKMSDSTSAGSSGANAELILVGNFGDGVINAYDLSGHFIGMLHDKNKNPIVIDGLWAIGFPPVAAGADSSKLYFTAGPDDEKDGLFGYLTK